MPEKAAMAYAFLLGVAGRPVGPVSDSLFMNRMDAGGGSGSNCPKCATSSDGKSNCCSVGGAWEGQCTLTLADGGSHTWSEGYDACDDSTYTPKAGVARPADCADWCSHWTTLAPECKGCQANGQPNPNLPAANAVALAAEEPRLELQIRKCDSEREEWCDGAQIESALPPGGDPKECITYPDAHLPDTWCVENCGFPVPNCPKKMCNCEPPSEEKKREEAEAKERKRELLLTGKGSLNPLQAAFERGRKSFEQTIASLKDKQSQKTTLPGATNLQAQQEKPLRPCESQWDGNCDRSAFQGPNGLFSRFNRKAEEKLRPCESQWDGNCDRSAFQGPNGIFAKKSPVLQTTVTREEDMSEDERKEWRRMHPDGIDWSNFNAWQNIGTAEWQAKHKELMKTDISGLPPEGDPTSCVAVSTAMSDAWCRLNCGGSPPNCPSALCKCKAAEGGAAKKGELGKWGRCPDCYAETSGQ